MSTCTFPVVTMAKIQFLTVLLTVAYLLGSIVSVTVEEFDVRTVFLLYFSDTFHFKQFLKILEYIGHLCSITGNVSFGFQSQSGWSYSCLIEAHMLHFTTL